MSNGADNFGKFDHLVVLMLENHSFDNILGWLYSPGNPPPYDHSPAGQPEFDGLGDGGAHSNPLTNAPNAPRKNVYRILTAQNPGHPGHSFPDPDPGEGYVHTNWQLLGTATPPSPPVAKMEGFILDYAQTLAGQQPAPRPADAAAGPERIMGCYDPTATSVLSELARCFAVCDRWFASVPSQTWPNRRFAHAGTSKGDVNNTPVLHDMTTIFDKLPINEWGVYTEEEPLTALLFPHLLLSHPLHFGSIAQFKRLAKAGKLPGYSFIEPRYFIDASDQLPSHSIPAGEQLIADVYNAVVNGKKWERTLLLITYDEHGGCYDHVPPPTDAVPPDAFLGPSRFDFSRFGVRVPAVFVSPYIEKGTILRPDGSTVFDHTSIIKTLRLRFGITEPLTKRDDAAPSFETVLSRTIPRSRDEMPQNLAPQGAPAAKLAAAAAPAQTGDEPLNPLQRSMLLMAANLPSSSRGAKALTLAAEPPESADQVLERARTPKDALAYISGRLNVLGGRRGPRLPTPR